MRCAERTLRAAAWLLLTGLGACTALSPAPETQGLPGPATAEPEAAAPSGPPPLDAHLVADFERAVAALDEGEYAAAVPLLSAVIERDPTLPGAHVNLAIARLHLDEEAMARESFAQALALAPGHPVAHNQLAILERRAGRFEAAREHYRRALAQRPDYAPVHLNLGILCDLYLRQADCALTHYARYVELAGEQAETVGLWIVDLRRRTGRE